MTNPNIKHQSENQMWVEKYRPQNFENIASNKSNLLTISNLLKKKCLPNLLFYGPPGTGKTTTALIVAKLLNGENSSHLTLELNASDTRGIDIVRHQIKSFAQSGAIFSIGTKFIILDESDAMTNSAQFALRRVIEQTCANVRFCFICNHLNKIIPAIQSRCTRLRFSILCENEITKKLLDISENESVQYSEEGIKAIIKLSNGDMRNCINVLQACWFGYGFVNEENVYKTTGMPSRQEMDTILHSLLNDSMDFCFQSIWDYQKLHGISLEIILQFLLERVLRIGFNAQVLILLIERMAEIENMVSKGSSDKLQLASLIATFSQARSLQTK